MHVGTHTRGVGARVVVVVAAAGGGGGDGAWRRRWQRRRWLAAAATAAARPVRVQNESVCVHTCVRACVRAWAGGRTGGPLACGRAMSCVHVRREDLPAQKSRAAGDSWQPESRRSRLPPSRRSWLTCARAGAHTGSDCVRGVHMMHGDRVGRLSGAAARRLQFVARAGRRCCLANPARCCLAHPPISLTRFP